MKQIEFLLTKGTSEFLANARAKIEKNKQELESLKQIEDENGRVRGSEKFAPRTLDLDLLTYDDTVIDNPIVLPREEILYNAFVLRPLADLVPQHMHPLVKKTYQSLWQQYDKQKQNLWVADYTWSKTKT